MGQKEPPRLGSRICYGQELARKSQRDWAVRFVTAKSWLEKATKTRQYDLLRPNVGQKEPPRLGSTICYGQELARKSHQDSAVRFVTAKSWPERATETRQYDLLRPREKEPPRPGSTICYGQTWARKSHQDSAIQFVTANRGRQYDLLRPRIGQKKPPRLGNTICYGQELARKKPARLGSTICYGQELARKSHQDSAVRFVTVFRGPERATKTRQYGLLRPNVGQREPTRLGSTICYGQELARKKPPRLGSTMCFGQERARKSHQDSAIRFVTAKSWPEKATNTLQYDLLRPTARATMTRQYDLSRPNVGQKKPPRLGSTICYGQELARKASETRQYDLLRPRVGQKEPPRLGSTICYNQPPPRLGSAICYGQTWARKAHQDSAIRFVTVKRGPERATKTRQYDLLRPRVGQKEPPRLGSTICYGQELARRSHQDSAVRFVTAKSWPERATKTRQYDLLRPNVGQKEPPKIGSTICYGQESAKRGPERATKIRQYDEI